MKGREARPRFWLAEPASDSLTLCAAAQPSEEDPGRAEIVESSAHEHGHNIDPHKRTRAGEATATLIATIAHLRIEDLHLDNDLKRIFQRHVDGEIGDEELAAAIDELNERRFGPLPVSGNARS